MPSVHLANVLDIHVVMYVACRTLTSYDVDSSSMMVIVTVMIVLLVVMIRIMMTTVTLPMPIMFTMVATINMKRR